MQWRLTTLFVLGALGACASETGSPSAAGDLQEATEGVRAVGLDLSAPEDGFQVQSRPLQVEAGDDVRLCEVVRVPGKPEDLYPVHRIEAAIGPLGRDLVVSAALPDSDTAAIMEPGDRVPCNRAGEAFGEELAGLISTQHSYLDQRYPDGVGNLLQGGQPLVLEYHVQNSTDEPVASEVKVNFHLTTASRVRNEAHLASLDNLTIYTPPRGESTHIGECGVGEAVKLSELVRRTRAFGTDFRVWLVGGERDGELLWHSADHRDQQYEFEAPLPLTPGQRLRFECSYHNTSNAELRFGTTGEDEICSLQATYWRDDEALADDKDGLQSPTEALLDADGQLHAQANRRDDEQTDDQVDDDGGEKATAVETHAERAHSGRKALGCLLLNVDEDGIARSE